MSHRKIVEIDENLCDGCGQCVTTCAEGAIQLIDGKARLVRDDYCDGLGACLGECPQGAIRITERDAADFDEKAVGAHLERLRGGDTSLDHFHTAPQRHVAGPEAGPGQSSPGAPHSCPGSRVLSFPLRSSAPNVTGVPAPAGNGEAPTTSGSSAPRITPSELRQWPIQLHLLPPTAPYLRDADLLLAADCAAFSSGDFHARYLKDHALAIACPKLDDSTGYVEKLARMITDGGVRSITVLMMQVPCCRGLEQIALLAMQAAGTRIPLRRVVLSLEGETLVDQL